MKNKKGFSALGQLGAIIIILVVLSFLFTTTLDAKEITHEAKDTVLTCPGSCLDYCETSKRLPGLCPKPKFCCEPEDIEPEEAVEAFEALVGYLTACNSGNEEQCKKVRLPASYLLNRKDVDLMFQEVVSQDGDRKNLVYKIYPINQHLVLNRYNII